MKENKENLYIMRHSAEHIMHQAVKELFPKIHLAMGPATEEGFYNDFDSMGEKISESDFVKIEKRMQQLIDLDLPNTKMEISEKEARKLFAGNPYKLEWVDDIIKRGEKITIYWTGKPGEKNSMVDLCSGPHVASTGKVGPFKLLSIAGAYWHGDEKNKMLTRIYGTAFSKQKDLDQFLYVREEAKKRDHRKLGKMLDLFTFSSLVGSGLPLYTQKGALIRHLLNEYVETLQKKAGYAQVWTPQITKAELFKKSGHYEKYKENLFKVISNYSKEEFFLKPMNCPQHTQIYASKPRSYKDLPIRMTDFAMLYRDEKPGELNGLARVRSFSQDDCHIFCREDQVDDEVDVALSMTKEVMSTFGFKYKYRLSTHDPQHPEKYLGDPKIWDKVEKWAEKIMQRNSIEYFDGPGEAAFYAPKMDLIATDALGREWQLSTVQIDYFMPERFQLTYTDKTGKDKQPIMIHRAIIGSPERLIMILIEHYAGAFPVWLSPIQVKVIPISDNHAEYAQEIAQKLEAVGVRIEVDNRDDTMQARIRDAQMQKIPYMIILGDREMKDKTLSIRLRSGKKTNDMKLEELIERINKEVAERKDLA